MFPAAKKGEIRAKVATMLEYEMSKIIYKP